MKAAEYAQCHRFGGDAHAQSILSCGTLSPPGSPDIQTAKEQAGLITPAAEVQTPFPHSLVPSSTLPSHGSASEALDPALNFSDEAWAVQLKDSFILSYLVKSVTGSLWKC